MIHTGDALEDGVGGQSVWCKEFEVEFHRNKSKHPLLLSFSWNSTSYMKKTSLLFPTFSSMRKMLLCIERDGMSLYNIPEPTALNHEAHYFYPIELTDLLLLGLVS